MARLFDNDSGALLGEISAEDVNFLIEQLEEESAEDVAYYVNQDTVTLLRAEGASQELLVVLEKAIAGSGEAEVRWEAS